MGPCSPFPPAIPRCPHLSSLRRRCSRLPWTSRRGARWLGSPDPGSPSCLVQEPPTPRAPSSQDCSLYAPRQGPKAGGCLHLHTAKGDRAGGQPSSAATPRAPSRAAPDPSAPGTAREAQPPAAVPPAPSAQPSPAQPGPRRAGGDAAAAPLRPAPLLTLAPGGGAVAAAPERAPPALRCPRRGVHGPGAGQRGRSARGAGSSAAFLRGGGLGRAGLLRAPGRHQPLPPPPARAAPRSRGRAGGRSIPAGFPGRGRLARAGPSLPFPSLPGEKTARLREEGVFCLLYRTRGGQSRGPCACSTARAKPSAHQHVPPPAIELGRCPLCAAVRGGQPRWVAPEPPGIGCKSPGDALLPPERNARGIH